MPFTFSTSQLSQLQTLRTAGLYADAYAFIVDTITDLLTSPDGVIIAVPAVDVPSNVWQWFQGAEQVNRGTGPFSDYIREYTAEQYRIRTGTEPASGFLQHASDEIAKLVIDDILSDGVLPSLAQIGSADAAKSTESFPNGDPAAWSGNLLFLALGDGTFFQRYLLHGSGSNADATDPYDFLAAVRSSQHAASATVGSFTLGGIAQAITTGLSLAAGPGATLDLALMASANSAAVNFFTSVYGQSPYYLDSHGIILDIQGRSGGLTGTTSGELIYASDGNDTILGTAGSDIVDGGAGSDTIIFQTPGSLSVIIEARSSVATYLGNVFGSGANNSLYRIESLITGSGNDVFLINSFSTGVSGLAIDGGQGTNTLSFRNRSDAVVVDLGAATATVGGTTIHLANIDNFIGGAGNDTFRIFNTSVGVEGGIGNDTVDFSLGGSGVALNTANWGDIESFIATDHIDSFELGGTGPHHVQLGGGNDGIISGRGADNIDGGSGSDVVSYANSIVGVTVDADLGYGAFGDAEGDHLEGIERVIGSAHNDTFTSGGGIEYWGGGGNDFMFAGLRSAFHGDSGVDTLSFAAIGGSVAINVQFRYASTGDTYSDAEYIIGTAGNDIFTGYSAYGGLTVSLYGGPGDDLFQVGDDVMASGDNGDDTFVVVGGQARGVDGGSGHDIVTFAYGGANYLNMTMGIYVQGPDLPTLAISNVEEVYLGGGQNIVVGTSGSEIIHGGGFLDIIYAGDGDDLIYANGYRTQDDGVHGGDGNDVIIGSAYDNIFGDAGEDLLIGGINQDFMFGGADADEFYGGAGDDVMSPGGGGGNLMFGEDGADQVIYGFTYGDDPSFDSGRLISIQEGGGGFLITTEQNGALYTDTAINCEFVFFAGQGWQLTSGFDWHL